MRLLMIVGRAPDTMDFSENKKVRKFYDKFSAHSVFFEMKYISTEKRSPSISKLWFYMKR
jgi:hypothetical protein